MCICMYSWTVHTDIYISMLMCLYMCEMWGDSLQVKCVLHKCCSNVCLCGYFDIIMCIYWHIYKYERVCICVDTQGENVKNKCTWRVAHVYTCIYMCMHMNVHKYICTHTHVICTRKYVCVCVCVCVCACVCVCMCVNLCVCVCACVCMQILMYTWYVSWEDTSGNGGKGSARLRIQCVLHM